MGGLLQPSSCTDASLAELVLDNALKEYSVPVWADPLLDSILGVNCPLEKDRAVGRGKALAQMPARYVMLCGAGSQDGLKGLAGVWLEI